MNVGSTSAAVRTADCPACGGARYFNLVHHCRTMGATLHLLNGAAPLFPPYVPPVDNAAAVPLPVWPSIIDTGAGNYDL